MNNTKIISIQSIKIIFLALIFAVPAVFTTSSIPVEAVTSSELQQQKNDIAQKIKDNVAQADSLSSQVDTLENRIASLDNEITTAQNEITQTESKIEELSVQITHYRYPDRNRSPKGITQAKLSANVQAQWFNFYGITAIERRFQYLHK